MREGKQATNHMRIFIHLYTVESEISCRRDLTIFVRERRKFIDMLASVGRAWDTEAKIKIKRLQQAVLEKVSLNHSKGGQGIVANLKRYPKLYQG